MPEICRFHGVVIRMFVDEHGRPHFHAVSGDHNASIDIEALMPLNGWLPPRKLRMVLRWAAVHQAELRENWLRARTGRPLRSIQPPK